MRLPRILVLIICYLAGEPGHRSGVTGDVIHFNATQATMMGHQYFSAYRQAMGLTSVVPSARTKACSTTAGGAAASAPAVTQCGSAAR